MPLLMIIEYCCAQRRFLFKELEFQLTVVQATIDTECDLPSVEAADAALRELRMRIGRIEQKRDSLRR